MTIAGIIYSFLFRIQFLDMLFQTIDLFCLSIGPYYATGLYLCVCVRKADWRLFMI